MPTTYVITTPEFASIVMGEGLTWQIYGSSPLGTNQTGQLYPAGNN